MHVAEKRLRRELRRFDDAWQNRAAPTYHVELSLVAKSDEPIDGVKGKRRDVAFALGRHVRRRRLGGVDQLVGDGGARSRRRRRRLGGLGIDGHFGRLGRRLIDDDVVDLFGRRIDALL